MVSEAYKIWRDIESCFLFSFSSIYSCVTSPFQNKSDVFLSLHAQEPSTFEVLSFLSQKYLRKFPKCQKNSKISTNIPKSPKIPNSPKILQKIPNSPIIRQFPKNSPILLVNYLVKTKNSPIPQSFANSPKNPQFSNIDQSTNNPPNPQKITIFSNIHDQYR